MTREQALAYRRKIENAASFQDDETALQSIELYPKWQPDMEMVAQSRYQYEGVLYRCVQSHTSQADWTPDKVPALFTVVSLDEWPEWVQPLGSEDAYNKDDKVSYNDKHWVSEIDGNIWAPGVYGWSEVS